VKEEDGREGIQSFMRLAILGTRGIPARYGGFETFAEQLSTRLVRRGIEVTVFCPSTFPRPDEVYQGVKLQFVERPRLGKYSEMIWDARCYWVARKGFDVVYMLGVGGSFGAWIPKLSGTSVWVNTDGIEWKRAKFTFLQRAYLAIAEAMSVASASGIVADASAIQYYLQNRYPGLKRITTIAYGAEVLPRMPDHTLIKQFGVTEDSYYLIVCRLEPENLIQEMVDGFKRSKSQLPLIVVGSIDNPSPYVRHLLQHQNARVRFVGTIYEKETLAAIRTFARAYLHGHTVGGTNPSLLEAMACSNLVIAHSNQFNREVLGPVGLFFDSPSSLAETVDLVDRGALPVDDLRTGAKCRILERYTWDHIADQYYELLHAGFSSVAATPSLRR
jgi:glycosyltransferase involved in cell wall biosynthesis